jgi:hypothetical protein
MASDRDRLLPGDVEPRERGEPYAFARTPAWVYPIGALTLFLPFGAVLAGGGGVFARRRFRRIGIALAACGTLALLLYVVGSIRAVVHAWGPVPV